MEDVMKLKIVRRIEIEIAREKKNQLCLRARMHQVPEDMVQESAAEIISSRGYMLGLKQALRIIEKAEKEKGW